jgi:hypothetical protein
MLTHWLKSLRQALTNGHISGGSRRGTRRRKPHTNGLACGVEQLESRTLLTSPMITPDFDVVPPEPAMIRMHRSFNPNADYTIFTTQKVEHDTLVSWGYRDQTTGRDGFNVLASDDEGAQPIHRLYNPNNGQHYFTLDNNERDFLDQVGWNVEPDMGYAFGRDDQQTGSTEIFMLYQKTGGDHIFTTNAAERDQLLAEPSNDWEQQTSLGFAFAVDTQGRLQSRTNGSVDGDVTEQVPPGELDEFLKERIRLILERREPSSEEIPAGGFHSFHLESNDETESLTFRNGPKATVRGTLHAGPESASSNSQPFVTVMGVNIPLNIGLGVNASTDLQQLDGQSVVMRGVFGVQEITSQLTLVEDFRQDSVRVVFHVNTLDLSGQETGPYAETMEYRFVSDDDPLYQWLTENFGLRRELSPPNIILDDFFGSLDGDTWKMFEEVINRRNELPQDRWVTLPVVRGDTPDMGTAAGRVTLPALTPSLGLTALPTNNSLTTSLGSRSGSSAGRGIVSSNLGFGQSSLTTSATQPVVTATSSGTSSSGARGITGSSFNSVTSTVGDWYNQAGSALNQTYNTLGYVAQDWGNQVTDAWGNSGQMFDYTMGGKNIWDAASSFGKFWNDPASISNVGGVLNNFIGLPGVIESQPWSAYEQDWLKAANDVLGIGLSLGEGNLWGAANTAIPNIFQAGDLLSQAYLPGVIDTLSGWGTSAMDYLGVNPWNPTSFGGSYDWQQGFQQLVGIGEGFVNGGFTGAARESIDPILQLGNEVGQYYFGEWIDSLSNGGVDFLNQYNLNPYGWGSSGSGTTGDGSFGQQITFDDNAPKGANLYGWSDTDYGYDYSTGTGYSNDLFDSGSYGTGFDFQDWFGDNSTGWSSYDADPYSSFDSDFFNNLGDSFGGGGYGSEFGSGWGNSGTQTFNEYASGYGSSGEYDWMSDGGYSSGWSGGNGSGVFTDGFFEGLNFEQYGYDETPTPHYEIHGYDSPSSWGASWDPIYQSGWGESYDTRYDTSYGDSGYGGYNNTGTGSSTDYSELLAAQQDALNAYNKRFEYDY